MVENQGNEIVWENFMKMLLDRLDIPTKADVQLLNERLERVEQLLFQKQPAQKQSKTKLAPRRKSASSVVLDVVASHPKGTNFKTVKAATGFDDKKLRNIIFRLDKIKRIKRVRRGTYKIF